MSIHSGNEYTSKDSTEDGDGVNVRHQPKIHFAQIEFPILTLTRDGVIRPADIATVVALLNWADYGSKAGSVKYAPSSKTVAAVLGIGRGTFWQSLKRLEGAGIVRRQSRRKIGETTVIDVTHPSEWATPEEGGVGGKPAQGVGGKPAQGVGGKPAQGVGGKPAHILESSKVFKNLQEIPASAHDADAESQFETSRRTTASMNRKSSTARKPIDPRVRPTQQTFADLYFTKTGNKYPPGMYARDGVAFRGLADDLTAEVIARLLPAYFATENEYYQTRSGLNFTKWQVTPEGIEATRRAKASRSAVVEVEPDEDALYREEEQRRRRERADWDERQRKANEADPDGSKRAAEMKKYRDDFEAMVVESARKDLIERQRLDEEWRVKREADEKNNPFAP